MPLLSGLVWQQGSGLFARWKEVFLLLTKDCVRCYKVSSAKLSQFGSLVFSLDLVLVSDIRYAERRGYLALVLESQGTARTYFRRTEGIREWGNIIKECVVKKKEEFDQYLSPSQLMRRPVLSPSDHDSWLLSRLAPTTCRDIAEEDAAKADTDSGMDSAATSDDRECVGHSDEMQEVRLNFRARNCKNIPAVRPKIPIRLCKVTKV